MRTILQNLRDYIESHKYLVEGQEINLNVTMGGVTKHKKRLDIC